MNDSRSNQCRDSNGNTSHNCCHSPLRAKRRQSDAKWRASVATCYDTLKYVVPNMKAMSKRKISKALILQESEKHIKELESAINYLLDVEGPSKGKTILWQEASCWSHCTLDKLQADFSQKQCTVFHTSTQGRRCYKLLHDIKEEVFSMQADAKKMAVVGENVIMSSLRESKIESPMRSAASLHYRAQSQHQALPEHSDWVPAAANGERNVTFANDQDTSVPKKDIFPFSSLGLPRKDSIQPRNHSSKDTIHWSFNGNQRHHVTRTPRQDEDAQIVPSSVSPSQLESHCSTTFTTQEIAQTIGGTGYQEDLWPGHLIKLENPDTYHDVKEHIKIEVPDTCESAEEHIKLEHLDTCFGSGKQEETNIVGDWKLEHSQEVPSVEPQDWQDTMAKRPRLDSTSSDSELGCISGRRSCLNSLSLDKSWISSSDVVTPNNTFCKRQAREKHLASSPADFFLFNTKSEDRELVMSEKGASMSSSSLSTPKTTFSTPPYCHSDSGHHIKRLSESSTARKMLNFNGQLARSYELLATPEKHVQPSPMISGFTPVKLPGSPIVISKANGQYSYEASPWKLVSSPLNCRAVPERYLDDTDLESHLMCLETIDTMDLDEGLIHEKTPSRTSETGKSDIDEKSQRINFTTTKKVSSCSSGINSQPKCRKRLEKFYQQVTHSEEREDTHVVPQLDKVCDEMTPFDDSLDIPTALGSPQSSLHTGPKDCLDFDGFYYYYRHVGERLKDRLEPTHLKSPSVAVRVAKLWERLPQHHKNTMTTLATLEGQGHGFELSPDLEEVEIKPLDPQEFIPCSFI